MRFTAPAWAALLLTGCLRFGYGAAPSALDGGGGAGTPPDGSIPDAGFAADSGRDMESGRMDASTAGGSGGSAARGGTGGGSGAGGSGNAAMDAGNNLDAGAGVHDAAGPDAGAPDGGAVSGAGGSGGAASGTGGSGGAASGTGGSGGTDAGTTDAGTNPEVDPKWTADCPGDPNILFCDDFETGLTKWSYEVRTRGTPSLSTDKKHNTGSYSLRAVTMASTSSIQSAAREAVKAFTHRKSGDLWARFWYYLPSSITLSDKMSLAAISEYEQPYFGFSVLVFQDGVGIENGNITRKSSTTFPRDQWVCVEMHVLVDASKGKFEFFLNGGSTSPTSITSTDTLPDQGYTSFEVGVHYTNYNVGAVTSYTDDVKLGLTRLGCN